MYLFIPFIVILCTEGIKILLKSIQSKRLRLDWFLHSGGFPSGHASFSSSICTIIVFLKGINDPISILSIGWAMLIMYDARGVRKTVSKHAQVLNSLQSSFQLEESIGHNNTEVLAGCSFGILFSLFLLSF